MMVFQTAAMRARSVQMSKTNVNPTEHEEQHHLGIGELSLRNASALHQSGKPMRQRRAAGAEHVDHDAVDTRAWLELSEAALCEPDLKGLCRLHRAAERGLIAVLEKTLANNKQLVEIKTTDGTGMTPLLVAVQVSD